MEQAMNATFNLNANELDENFLESIKKLFKNKKISINIEIAEIEDETTYLLSNEKNAKRVLNAINNIEQKKNLIYKNLEEL